MLTIRVHVFSFFFKIHLVHWNSIKYKTPSEAVSSHHHDGLAVLGTFVKVLNNIFMFTTIILFEYIKINKILHLLNLVLKVT